jgi:hypothetical protein
MGDRIVLFSDDIVDGNTYELVFKHYHSQDNPESSKIIIKVTKSRYADEFCETFDGKGILLGTINGKELYVYVDNDLYKRIYAGIFVGPNEKRHNSKNCIFYGSLNFLKLYSYKFEKDNVDQEIIWESNTNTQNAQNDKD